MKFQNIVILSAIFIAQLFNPCTIQGTTRASLDIGSGDTKIVVADVDPKTNKITKILQQKYVTVGLRADLAKSVDGCVSEKIQQELINSLKAMQQEAQQHSPKEWVAVGTSVFRTAKNGQDIIDRVKTATGIHIHLLPQNEEAEIGFSSAIAVSGQDPEKIVSWDSGAGSFQISSLIDGKLEMYGAEFAYVPAFLALYEHRKKPHVSGASPNPIDADEAWAVIDIIRSKLPPIPSWLAENKKQIIAIGNFSIFSMATEVIGQPNFTKEQVKNAMLQLCGKTDDQLSHLESRRQIIVALILLYSIMDHCGFDQISFIESTGNCEGLLITPRFWPMITLAEAADGGKSAPY